MDVNKSPGDTARHIVSEITGNLRVRQASTLYLASLAGIPLAIFTSIVFTRFLGPEGYGNFAFLDSLFDVARIIFPLGFFYAGNRSLVLNKHKSHSGQYHGATLSYLFLSYIAMAVVMVVFGLFDPNLAEKGLTSFFFLLIPFGWIFLLGPYFDNMLHPDNRIYELAATRFFPKVITFSAALLIWFFLRDFEGNRLAIVWTAYLSAFLTIYVVVFARIRLSFGNIRERMKTVRHHHRTYGVHLYVGGLFSTGAMALTAVLISYYSPDNRGVGFFTLAMAISRPLALIPGAIAATWFKEFSTQQKIDPRLFAGTVALTLLAFIALLLLAGPFVRLVYTDDFLPVISLVYIVGVAMLFYGVASFFNRFLESKGLGKTVRNVYISMGITLLVMNLWLIPGHGAMGAALAMAAGSVVYFGGMTVGYMRRNRFREE